MPGMPRIAPLADDALLLHFGERIDDAINARVHALAARLRADAPRWLVDLVPAHASLAVFYDPAAFDDDPFEPVVRHVRSLLAAEAPMQAATAARMVEVPVAYGGESGPDLESAAIELGLQPEALAARHAAGDYRVAMIGFAPGFPYLSGLDPALALPRLATPRIHVPAGSVAIGGAQTGIYPRESAGGWRIIGRTPLLLFDPQRVPPSLLAPGDRVRFVAIDAEAFDARAGGGA